MPQLHRSALLASLREIAEFAQVRRPVVTTWRRRYPNFPPQAGGNASQPLFDLHAVCAWLEARSLGNTTPERARSELAFHSLVDRAKAFDSRDLVAVTTALLCLRYLDNDEPLVPDRSAAAHNPEEAWAELMLRAEALDRDDECLLTEILAAGPGTLELALFADDTVEATYSTRAAFEWLLGTRHRLGLVALAADAVAPQLPQLIAQLCGVAARAALQESITVADPAAGPGDLLKAVMDVCRSEEVRSGAGVTYLGAEPDHFLARILHRRMLIHGVNEFDFDIHIGPEPTREMGDPDFLITSLPYQPSEQRDPMRILRRIKQIADLLGPGCAAVVHGPADVLTGRLHRFSVEERARTEMLASGVVEAIVRLPGGLLPSRPGYQSALWALTRDPIQAARGRILILDAAAGELTDPVAAQLAEDVEIWRAEGFRPSGHEARYGGPRNISSLINVRNAGDALEAPRWRGVADRFASAPEQVARLRDAETRWQQAGQSSNGGPFQLAGRLESRRGNLPCRTTLGALIEARRLSLLPGARIAARHIVTGTDFPIPIGQYQVLGSEEALGRARIGIRRLDRDPKILEYRHVDFTEAGDLIVTTTPQFGAIVDDQGTSVAVFPARVLRIREQRGHATYTPRVLAALLQAARDTARAAGAVRSARGLTDYELPDLSQDDIRRFDAYLADLERERLMLREQSDALDEVYRLAIRGLADGTLASTT